jgi:hypothetical protein
MLTYVFVHGASLLHWRLDKQLEKKKDREKKIKRLEAIPLDNMLSTTLQACSNALLICMLKCKSHT